MNLAVLVYSKKQTHFCAAQLDFDDSGVCKSFAELQTEEKMNIYQQNDVLRVNFINMNFLNTNGIYSIDFNFRGNHILIKFSLIPSVDGIFTNKKQMMAFCYYYWFVRRWSLNFRSHL